MLLHIALDVYRNSTSPVPIDAGHLVTSSITETNYTDCGNVYNRYYAVTAVNENGESDPSNEDRASESCGSAMAMTLPVLNATTLTESGGDPVVTKYYFHGGKRVAMDREGVVQYLVGDHLGTTSLVLDEAGNKVAESRHYPYGEERWSSGTLPTDRRFTGQKRIDSAGGIYHMGARFYDSQIGRWTSPDTIIPDFADPQSLNRYSYVLNRPLTASDWSGHIAAEEEEEALALIAQLCSAYGICLEIDFGYMPLMSPGPGDPTWIWEEGQLELYQLQFQLGAHQMHDRFRAGEMTALDYLANVVEYRAGFGHEETFVDDISSIILGFSGVAGVVLPPFARNAGVGLTDSGFNDTWVFPDLSTYADNSNQPNHFWYYVHSGYTTGALNTVGIWNEAHENPNLPLVGAGSSGGAGATQADLDLGYRGIDLGKGLREGTVDINELGNWIRRELGACPIAGAR